MKNLRRIAFATMLLVITVNFGITGFGAPKKQTVTLKSSKATVKKPAVKKITVPKKPVVQKLTNAKPVVVQKPTTVKPVETPKPPVKQVTRGEEEKAIKEVIDLNVKSFNDGNVDQYMTTVFPHEPEYSQTAQALKEILSVYKFNMKIVNFEITGITGDTAFVTMTTETRKISGPAYQDNSATSKNTLKKYNGKWTFSETVLISAVPLVNTTTGSGVDLTTTGSGIDVNKK